MIRQLLAQKTQLGPIEPPSSPYGFNVLDNPINAKLAAANRFEKILSLGIGGVTLIAGIYFLFAFLVAAFTWISAGGDSGKVETARNSMTNALIGMVIMVAAYAIFGVIGTMLGLNLLTPGALILQLAPSYQPTP